MDATSRWSYVRGSPRRDWARPSFPTSSTDGGWSDRQRQTARPSGFIRTLLGGWAYGAIYGSSSERTNALAGWLFRYNHHQNHSAIARKPPIARLNEQNNLLGTYS